MVIGGITALVGILAVYDIISNISEDNSFADYASFLVDTSSTTLTVTGQPTAQDVADCASFTGWLQTDCLQSKVTDRKSVSVWTDDQVREANRSALICVFPVFECIQFGLAFSPPHPLASLPARPPATPPPPSRPLSRTHTTNLPIPFDPVASSR